MPVSKCDYTEERTKIHIVILMKRHYFQNYKADTYDTNTRTDGQTEKLNTRTDGRTHTNLSLLVTVQMVAF